MKGIMKHVLKHYDRLNEGSREEPRIVYVPKSRDSAKKLAADLKDSRKLSRRLLSMVTSF